jgi:NADH-quinone oxidoreductase subunit B
MSTRPQNLPGSVDEAALRPSSQIGASAGERAEHFELGGSEDTSVVMTTVQAMANWSRKNSIWPLPLGLSCCGIEFMSVAASRFDMSRFGMEVARFSPRQADLMLVAGTLTYKMAQAMTRLYDQMSEPKWVIAMGACASSGGMFRSYPVVQGIDEFIPVDFYIPGCPPRPEAVLECLMQLQKRIERDRSYRVQVRHSPLAAQSAPAPTVLPRPGREQAAPALSTSEERFVEPAPHADLMRVLASKEVT